MRYFSTFGGVGGFEIGIQNAYANSRLGDPRGQDIRLQQGQEAQHDPGTHLPVSERDSGQFDAGTHTEAHCVGFSEIDKYASAVLQYHFPDNNYGDITKIEWDRVPDFDLLVGGSPCQDFSVAGKRAGLEGRRSGLFSAYINALVQKKPAYFIWENVKGVLSSNGGRDFAAIIGQMAEAGYSLWWQVLNAKDFGVPQNRERVFVVGSRNRPAREVLFERGEVDEVTQKDSARMIQLVGDRDKPSLSVKNYAFTIPANPMSDRGQLVEDPRRLKKVRQLTPLECERLMSWPDSWTRLGNFDGEEKEISDSQRYKMCGNGVVSKVVEEIVRAHLL